MPLYEHRSQPLLPRRRFVRRLLGHAAIAAALLSVSLALGILGYHFLVGLTWLDSLLNASMILGGRGRSPSPHPPAKYSPRPTRSSPAWSSWPCRPSSSRPLRIASFTACISKA
jgi:hypothetical protein